MLALGIPHRFISLITSLRYPCCAAEGLLEEGLVMEQDEQYVNAIPVQASRFPGWTPTHMEFSSIDVSEHRSRSPTTVLAQSRVGSTRWSPRQPPATTVLLQDERRFQQRELTASMLMTHHQKLMYQGKFQQLEDDVKAMRAELKVWRDARQLLQVDLKLLKAEVAAQGTWQLWGEGVIILGALACLFFGRC